MSTENVLERLPLEAALERTGIGAYSYRLTCLAGVAVISYACVCYNGTILVPASACELNTNVSQQGIMVAGPFMAGVLGSVMWGYFGDKYGRKKMLEVALASAALANALGSVSLNWGMFLALQCSSTLFASGIYPLAMTLLSESVPLARRNLMMLIVSSLMMASQGLMSSLAIPIIPLPFSYYLPSLGIYWNSWRTLMLVYSLPACIALLGIFLLVQESPKFILVKGDEKGALGILDLIYRVNNGSKDFLVHGLTFDQSLEVHKPSTKDQIIPLFRPPLRKYTFIMTLLFMIMQFIGGFFVWLPKISNQFVKVLQTGEGSNLTLCAIIKNSINAPRIPGDAAHCSLDVTALLMVLVFCGMQFACNGVLGLVVDRFGRRNSAMVLVTLCGASGALVNLVPNAVATALLFGGFLVGINVVGPYTAMAVALFPTHLRTLAVAITMSCGRLCGFFTIQIGNYMLVHNCRLGFFIYSAVVASSALVLIFLPNDRSIKSNPDIKQEEGVALKLLIKPIEKNSRIEETKGTRYAT